jgi:Na+-driven multidrug efflux pump
LFIFWFSYGVKGAAIATVISQMAACTYFFSFYLRKRSFIRISRKDLRISFGCLKEISALGIPAFVQTAGMSLLALVINNTLGRYGGDEAIAIYGMVHRLISLIIFPVLGVAQGLQPIAGYTMGTRFSPGADGPDYGHPHCLYGISFWVPDHGIVPPALRPDVYIGRGVVCFRYSRHQDNGDVHSPGCGTDNRIHLFPVDRKPKESFILGLSRQFLILIPIVLVLPASWAFQASGTHFL